MAIKNKFRDKELQHAKVLQLKRERQEFSDRNAKFHENLKNNEIIVLPSLDIPNVDGIPMIDIIE